MPTSGGALLGFAMSAFEAFAADSLSPWITGSHGETVVYVKADGTRRTIQATIIRNPPAVDPATGRDVAPKMRVLVRNHPTLGIASTELDTGGDKIEVAYRVGTAAQAYAVAWNPDDDQAGGMLNLKLR